MNGKKLPLLRNFLFEFNIDLQFLSFHVLCTLINFFHCHGL